MKCEEIREDLGAYLDDELGSARRSELDGHLASCEACTAELERLRRLSRLVADVPRATAPAGLAARIVSAAREPRPRVLRLSRWTGGLAAVAAVLLVGVVSIVALRERDARDMVGRVAGTLDEGPAPTPAAGEARTGAALDREKLEEPAVIERRRLARKGRGPAKRRDATLKKETASRPAESAAASGSPAARAHGKGAATAAEKAVAARTPAAPKPVRRWRKGKADAAPPAPREPLVRKGVGFRETRGKVAPGRAVAKQTGPAQRGEQVQVEVQAPGPEAEDSDRSRRRLVDQLRDRKIQEGLESRQSKEGKDRATEALFAKTAKAKAPARKTDRAGGEHVIRLQLRAGSASKELARIIAAAERLGGGVSRRAETKAVREQAIRPPARDRGAADQDETAARRPGVVRVRIPRDRAGEFLASVEGLALPETGGESAGRRARTQTRSDETRAPADEGQRGAARSRATGAAPSQTRVAAQQGDKPTQRLARWVVIEIVIRTPRARAAEVEAARQSK